MEIIACLMPWIIATLPIHRCKQPEFSYDRPHLLATKLCGQSGIRFTYDINPNQVPSWAVLVILNTTRSTFPETYSSMNRKCNWVLYLGPSGAWEIGSKEGASEEGMVQKYVKLRGRLKTSGRQGIKLLKLWAKFQTIQWFPYFHLSRKRVAHDVALYGYVGSRFRTIGL